MKYLEETEYITTLNREFSKYKRSKYYIEKLSR